jgi:hypothetical protein
MVIDIKRFGKTKDKKGKNKPLWKSVAGISQQCYARRYDLKN